jgi:cob(I)alamin adenosyltransferase
MSEQAYDVSNPPTHRSPKASGDRKGLIILHTGHGKGKTTAALGLMARAHGRGFKTKLFQFIKHEGAKFGEHRSFDQLGIPYEGLGDGFSWRSQDLERSKTIAQNGWQKCKEAISGGLYDLIVLDEITYPINWGWLNLNEVLETLGNRPEKSHVILTGRDAPEKLITISDTVTEMKKIKHAFDANVPAQRGIEH